MSEEILVNVTPQETRFAVVENGVLQEIIIERQAKRGLVGNIYIGKVSRVLPGMQAAFIDIGLERTAFLHISDIVGQQNHNNNNHSQNRNENESITGESTIEQILCENQTVMVQVVKDPLGTKGARLNTHLSIPSRFLVLMPFDKTVAISQRIETTSERERLKKLFVPPEEGDEDNLAFARDYGFIFRTAAEGQDSQPLVEDVKFLVQLWQSIEEKSGNATSVPTIIYEDLPMFLRILRSLDASTIEKIRIDSRETYDRAIKFTQQFVPDLVPHIEHYPGERPIMDLYSVEDEFQKALNRKVQLKSGGHLVFDQTEAMTTVDVNTGTFVGNRNFDETIFKTNLEAAQALARQLRLRNLGGIIIVDFIDMIDPEHQRQVLRALEKSLSRDHSKVGISEITSLGLVQLTRKRTRESLEHIVCEPCPTCKGSGSIKTVESICYEIFREIIRESRQFEARKFLIVAAQAVVDRLLDEESDSIVELEEFIQTPIQIQAEPMYLQEQYDVVLL